LEEAMDDAMSFEGPPAVASEAKPSTERYGTLFDRHHARLYALGLRLTWNADDARDLVQECFVRAIETGRIPAGDDDAGNWLVRVLVNLCRDRHRRLAVRRAHARTVPDSDPAITHDPAVNREVRAAVLALPVRQRAVVVLHDIEGRSIGEIAAMLGVAAVTARWHLHTARRKLREALGR